MIANEIVRTFEESQIVTDSNSALLRKLLMQKVVKSNLNTHST